SVAVHRALAHVALAARRARGHEALAVSRVSASGGLGCPCGAEEIRRVRQGRRRDRARAVGRPPSSSSARITAWCPTAWHGGRRRAVGGSASDTCPVLFRT